MKDINDSLRPIILGLALVLLLVGCGEQEPQSQATDLGQGIGLDETFECPEGEVGWRFPATALNKNTEAYDRRAGEDGEVAFAARRAIDVVSYTCSGSDSDSSQSGSAVRAIRRACNGKSACEFEDVCSSPQIEYVCGADDVDANGNQVTYTRTGSDVADGTVALGCEQPVTDEETGEARTACIPEQCHGRTRRNQDMECVPDSTKIEALATGRVTIARPLYKPFESYVYDSKAHPSLYPKMPYEFEVEVHFKPGLVPETSTLTVWLEDEWIETDTQREAFGYRCAAFKVDIEKDHPHRSGSEGSSVDEGTVVYSKKVQTTLSEECFEGGIARQNASRNAGMSQDDFVSQFEKVGTTMNISYDMEGSSVWHKGSLFNDTPEEIANQEPECTPNPAAFYYDQQTDTYDMRAYYAQRAFASREKVRVVTDNQHRRVEIGTIDIHPRRELKIRTESNYNPSLPVDISWYAVNYADNNPYNPFPTDKEVGGAWQNGEQSNENPEDYNWGPVNLSAVLYVFPVDGNFRARGREVFNKLAEMPLTDPVPEGKTDTFNIEITDRVKSIFNTPARRRTYVGGDVRAFDLFYCIESDHPTPRANPNQSDYAFNPKWSGYGFPRNFAVDPEGPGSSVYLESPEGVDAREPDYEDSDQNYWGQNWRGCRRSKTPLLVRIDRFTTPTEPISAAGFNGFASGTKTGDKKMSGQNDNDSEVNCQNASKTDCKEVMKGGNRTDGEGGRSTYDVTTASQRNMGDNVSADLKAEMLGMQLIDPSDPESSEADWPSEGSAGPVTMKIAPDWDALREGLDRATQANPAVDWDTGSYGGAMGLGVGWGYKFRWQIGPVPVLVTFSITVGASLELFANFYFEPGDGEGYPCLDEESSCYELSSDAATFEEAVDACAHRGGRLAERSSTDEGNAVLNEQPSSDDIWIGAQLAYRHPKPQQCEHNYNEAACAPDSKTEYRWLSSSVAFASHDGRQAVDVASNQIFPAHAIQSAANLSTMYPNDAAVYSSPSGDLKVAPVSDRKRYMCVFEPAGDEDYFKWDMGVTMGVAAGFALSGCAPSDDIGFCVNASFNVVALTIAAVFENAYHWIYREGESEPFSRRGTVGFSIPWTLSVFEGSVSASVHFLWYSAEWVLAAYNGITLDEGKLFDWNTTVMENF
jgi:hypothetical protein